MIIHRYARQNEFGALVNSLRMSFLDLGEIVDTGEWQAIRDESLPQTKTVELEDVTVEWEIPKTLAMTRREVMPNLPWADSHFMERVSGSPLNPPPSHEHWPYAQADNGQHRQEGQFSHTYPERFWPRRAGNSHGQGDPAYRHFEVRRGIRFAYGDYSTLIELLRDRPYTRQAYLPIWFPEDLQASREGERVPCTLGYHLLIRGNKLKLVYYIRSCDFRRHFRDDVYLAVRLARHVCEELNLEWQEQGKPYRVEANRFVMHISSLHVFNGEQEMLRQEIRDYKVKQMGNML